MNWIFPKTLGYCAWLTLCSGGVPAQNDVDLTDPVEILRKADAAAREIKAIRYTASSTNTRLDGSAEYRVEGTVVMSGWSVGAPARYRCDAALAPAGSKETRRFVVGNDGDSYFFVDHGTRTAYIDTDPAVVGTAGGRAHQLRRDEFVHPTPFSDELNGDKHDLVGTAKIGREECYVVKVVYAVDGSDTKWYFSKKSFLPWGCDRRLRGAGGVPLINQWRMSKVTIDPKFGEDPFVLRLPDGYIRTSEFAP